MAPPPQNPDRNFSADGVPEGVERRKEAVRRSIVARRFRLFFASLVIQLTGGAAQLWDKAEQRDRSADQQRRDDSSEDPARSRSKRRAD